MAHWMKFIERGAYERLRIAFKHILLLRIGNEILQHCSHDETSLCQAAVSQWSEVGAELSSFSRCQEFD